MLLTIYVITSFSACVMSQSVTTTGPSTFQCNCGFGESARPSLVKVSKTDTLEYEKVLKLRVEEIAELFFSVPRSCDHISNTSSSGWYLISPDPGKVLPFYVFCNFTKDRSETVIFHFSMNEIKASSCFAPRCSKHKIVYKAEMPQIEALINQSKDCQQHVKYRCNNTYLLEGYCGAWLSRNGTPQFYWGGASSKKDGFCACGETINNPSTTSGTFTLSISVTGPASVVQSLYKYAKLPGLSFTRKLAQSKDKNSNQSIKSTTDTCVMSFKKCNCDQNDYPETSDEGFLTDKETLPVTELQFGDLDSKIEYGYHTVGPLVCWGRS